MCEISALELALRAYMANKTPETLFAIYKVMEDMSNDDLWASIDAITTGTDTDLKLALAEAAAQTRPATEEETEDELWYNIDGTVVPIFSFLMDNYTTSEEPMAHLARVIVDYYQADPEGQSAIIAVLTATRATVGFHSTAGADSEDGIYSEILPPMDEPEATAAEDVANTEPAPTETPEK